jgi:hypothetical protein
MRKTKTTILLGYELGTAKEVFIEPTNMIVTGITQLSGKTTTLESLLKRSGLNAIVFKTKIGERSFTNSIEIAPFFRERSDFEFVRSLIEAYAREKLVIEKGTLMRLCKGSVLLVEIKKRVDDTLAGGKLRGLKEEIYTRLQHYLENLIPQIQYSNLSKTLNINDGLNVMNLERFSQEAQSLIIQSVTDEILNNMRDIVVVIPEAWKFLPQKYNNPCKRSVESFIRQGSTNNNYVWIDSQDMAGVDKTPLKQVSCWILGYQTERNEVKHTLDQIALPAKSKPSVNDIMKLPIGHFVLSSHRGVQKIYVRPHWLDEDKAKAIAMGERDVDSVAYMQPMPSLPTVPQIQTDEPKLSATVPSDISSALIQIRIDFFNKLSQLNETVASVIKELNLIKSQSKDVNIDEITSLVLQKIKLPAATPFDRDEIIREVVGRIGMGTVTYTVAPLEKIKKDFLIDAKNKIIDDIQKLSPEQKKILKFVETQGKGCNQTHILSKCLYVSATSGGTRNRISTQCKEMAGFELVRMDKNAVVYAFLKDRIKQLMTIYDAKEEEIEQVYNHILNDLI